jgi:hypothetical protein
LFVLLYILAFGQTNPIWRKAFGLCGFGGCAEVVCLAASCLSMRCPSCLVFFGRTSASPCLVRRGRQGLSDLSPYVSCRRSVEPNRSESIWHAGWRGRLLYALDSLFSGNRVCCYAEGSTCWFTPIGSPQNADVCRIYPKVFRRRISGSAPKAPRREPASWLATTYVTRESDGSKRGPHGKGWSEAHMISRSDRFGRCQDLRQSVQPTAMRTGEECGVRTLSMDHAKPASVPHR